MNSHTWRLDRYISLKNYFDTYWLMGKVIYIPTAIPHTEWSQLPKWKLRAHAAPHYPALGGPTHRQRPQPYIKTRRKVTPKWGWNESTSPAETFPWLISWFVKRTWHAKHTPISYLRLLCCQLSFLLTLIDTCTRCLNTETPHVPGKQEVTSVSSSHSHTHFHLFHHAYDPPNWSTHLAAIPSRQPHIATGKGNTYKQPGVRQK